MKIERSALLTAIGIILFFAFAIAVVLIAPRHVDDTWTSPASDFQVQMYEVSDPHLYISTSHSNGEKPHAVQHAILKTTWFLFQETENLHIVAPKELEVYVTGKDETPLKFTQRLLLLRKPTGAMKKQADDLLAILNPSPPPELKSKKNENDTSTLLPTSQQEEITVLELYDPMKRELFIDEGTGSILPYWADRPITILDETGALSTKETGVVYAKNPQEFLYTLKDNSWAPDPAGKGAASLEELTAPPLSFTSRQQLIAEGEKIYAIEGCWYCHTDQTRTLISDVVMNGANSYPAPPSSANEYIYQNVTFPGTRRVGPDLSREGVKRPSREWHLVHFWNPKRVVPGTLMPSFHHFFDATQPPLNTSSSSLLAEENIPPPNRQFEALYQYMMTKGTRITAPSQAWWLGKDPVDTKQIINGESK